MKNKKKNYTTLLFDADDTLLDFQANEYDSLTILFETLRYPLDDEIRALYHDLNKEMWLDFEQGKVTKEKLCNTRFQILFEKLGKEVDGVRAEAIYREALGRGSQTISGAHDVCRALAEKYKMCIVTNGVYATQMRRLKDSGLDRYFEKIFVSEKMGCSKPSPEFFERVLAALSGARADEILIVGDSLTSDIQGGRNAGIDTCWFNPHHSQHDGTNAPDYEIASLEEIFKILS